MNSVVHLLRKNNNLFKMSENWEKNEEIQMLREYLRIPSVHPNIDYGSIFKWNLIYFANEWIFV